MSGCSQYTIVTQLGMIYFTDIVQQIFPVEFAIITVYAWYFLLKLILKTFRKTSHDKKFSYLTVFFRFFKFENHLNGFFLRIANKPAGIHYHNFTVNSLGIMRYIVSIRLKLKHQLFGVNQVFRTSERNDIYIIFSHESFSKQGIDKFCTPEDLDVSYAFA